MTAPDARVGAARPEEPEQWKKLRASKPAIPYLLYYPSMREVARQHGYALAIHGSLTRDFDLIAVAWTPEASEPDVLVEAICAENQLLVTVPDDGTKPHGRVGYTIQGIADVDHGWVDLSVIPPRAASPPPRRPDPATSEREPRVHNHGPEDGPGLACREQIINGRLVGACLIPSCSAVDHQPHRFSGDVL